MKTKWAHRPNQSNTWRNIWWGTYYEWGHNKSKTIRRWNWQHGQQVIASKEGVEFVKDNLPSNSTIWVGGIDPEMTAESYIVPGLGDAGDLAYGSKKDEWIG